MGGAVAVSRGHYRSACFGGSVSPDPLVTAVAESGDSLPTLARGAFPTVPVAEAFDDVSELALLDEQLEIVAARTHDDVDLQDLPEPSLALLRSLGFTTPHALLSGSLRRLRSILARSPVDRDSERWATYHVILGCALRLRSQRMPLHRRTAALIEAVRAFDVAYYVYATNARPLPATQSLHIVKSKPMRHRHREACAAESDGAALIARAISAPTAGNTYLLSRAAMWLRVARSTVDPSSWEWLANSNNLACALTLLGSRTPTAAGTGMLREATHVLAEALRAHVNGHRSEDRDATLINLAETLLSLAERETPNVRLQKAERALAASSIALLSVVPPEYRWFVRLQRLPRAQ
jgi:hypothetical protein